MMTMDAFVSISQARRQLEVYGTLVILLNLHFNYAGHVFYGDIVVPSYGVLLLGDGIYMLISKLQANWPHFSMYIVSLYI